MEAFRAEVRAWIQASCPPSMRVPSQREEDEVWGGRKGRFPSDDARRWLERMAERGFTAPTWPREYGGAGLDAAHARVLDEELRRAGCRVALRSLGIWMLGPVLLRFGSEEQKRRHLPPIARGEIRWCQGYSEPGAGSDLASLDCRAVRDGDDYVVTGQKVWTSHAERADWMFCLVRTDPAAPKRDGISFLLCDLATPGITVRPIRLISGASPFCETFFDGARVPAGNLVGRPGEGWTIAKALLDHEREAVARLRDQRTDEEEPLEALARRYVGLRDGVLADPVLRHRIAQANLDFLCSKLTLARSKDASMLKLYGTELNQRRRDLRVLIAGYRGLGWEGEGFAPEELAATRDWLRSRANSIEGGTSEIQLNILAKRALGLPD